MIDVEKLLLDRAKLTEHCINKPEDDVMTAAEAVMDYVGTRHLVSWRSRRPSKKKRACDGMSAAKPTLGCWTVIHVLTQW